MIFKFRYGPDTPQAGQHIVKNITEHSQVPKCIGFPLLSVVWRKIFWEIKASSASVQKNEKKKKKDTDLLVHC